MGLAEEGMEVQEEALTAVLGKGVNTSPNVNENRKNYHMGYSLL